MLPTLSVDSGVRAEGRSSTALSIPRRRQPRPQGQVVTWWGQPETSLEVSAEVVSGRRTQPRSKQPTPKPAPRCSASRTRHSATLLLPAHLRTHARST